MSQPVIRRISPGEARLGQAKIIVRARFEHPNLPFGRSDRSVAPLFDEVNAARMVAMTMGEQDIPQPRQIAHRELEIFDQTLGLNTRARVDQSILVAIVEQIRVAIEIVRKSQLTAAD